VATVAPGVPRAPLRSVHGLETVRVSLDFGFETVLGSFALDSSAPVSTVSPSWLQTQGVLAQLFVDRKVRPVRWAFWKRARLKSKPRLQKGEARPIFVFQVKVGGIPVELKALLPVESVLLRDADGDPLCCDGVLGREFFDQFRVEYRPGEQAVALLHDPSVSLETEALQGGAWSTLVPGSPPPRWDFKTRWIWDVPGQRVWKGPLQGPPEKSALKRE